MLRKNIIDAPQLRNRTRVFADRTDAGHVLAALLQPLVVENARVLAIPAGGFPVARSIADALQLPLEFLVASKMLLPDTTEAGFGALAFDGSEWLNHSLIDAYRLTADDIEFARRQASTKVRRRFAQLCSNHAPDVRGRQVIVVDDGLASGATLYATLNAVNKLKPQQVIVALPTGSERSVLQVAQQCDLLVCANIRAGYPYAVASAYRQWQDVEEASLLAGTATS